MTSTRGRLDPVKPDVTDRRQKCPTVLQMEAVECGAAALAMILGYYGRWKPLEELRVLCGISRDGSKASSIVRAARSLGLTARGKKIEIDELDEIDLPAIIFWEFNHFLVVEGFKGDTIYLRDPASGPRKISWEEFEKSFTGVVLEFEPGPDFEVGGKRPSLVRTVLNRLGRSGGGLSYVAIAGLAVAFPGLLIAGFLREFVDSFLVGGQRDQLSTIFGVLGVAVVLTALFTAAQTMVLVRLQAKLNVRMSTETVDRLIKLPMRFFTQRSPGDLAYRVGLNDEVAELLSQGMASAIVGLLTATIYLVIMFVYSAILAAVAVLAMLFNIALLRFVARRRQDMAMRIQREQADFVSDSHAGIALIETIKSSGVEDDVFERWSSKLANLTDAQQRAGIAGLSLSATPSFLSGLTSVAILCLGAYLVMQGSLTIGTLVAFQVLTTSFIAPISQLVGLGSQLQDLSGNVQRLDDVLNTEPDPIFDDPPAGGPTEIRGELELRDVTFGYSPLAAPLIEGFSVHIKPGQRVALVGASGSGKSTVAKLVTGLFESWSGEVLIDGMRRESFDRRTLAAYVSMVDQDIALFAGTIKENLTLWDETISDQALALAAGDSAILDDITSRPLAFDGPIEEGGRNFSGGQRQRFEIARALARDPRILILDEATSALDPLTELEIDRAVRRRGCTCLVVAHRLSTIRDCDEIIVLDSGKIVERGTHDELMETKGAYANLVGV